MMMKIDQTKLQRAGIICSSPQETQIQTIKSLYSSSLSILFCFPEREYSFVIAEDERRLCEIAGDKYWLFGQDVAGFFCEKITDGSVYYFGSSGDESIFCNSSLNSFAQMYCMYISRIIQMKLFANMPLKKLRSHSEKFGNQIAEFYSQLGECESVESSYWAEIVSEFEECFVNIRPSTFFYKKRGKL